MSSLAISGIFAVSEALFGPGEARDFFPILYPAVQSIREARFVYISAPCGAANVGQPVLRGSGTNWTLIVDAGGSPLCGIPRGGRTFIALPPQVLGKLVVSVNWTLGVGRSGTHNRQYRVSGSVPGALSGTWYQPSHAKQGVMLTVAQSGTSVQWNTYDAEGHLLWLSGFAPPPDPATGDPNVIGADLYITQNGAFAASTGDPTAKLWGSVTIEYLACGRIRFSWDAIDPIAVPAGSTEMVQLTGTDDNCAVDPAKPTIDAIIVQTVFEG